MSDWRRDDTYIAGLEKDGQRYRSRIAELEAENSNIREDEREGDRVLSAWVRRAEQAEAELVALRNRRCDGCVNWDPDEHTYGWCETVLDEYNPIATRPDFACNRWQPREGDE